MSDETKIAQCRTCGKEYTAKVTTFTRKDKIIARWDFWCSSACYRKHLKDVRRKN